MRTVPLGKEPGSKMGIAILSVLFFMLFCSICYYVFYARYHPGEILGKALSNMEESGRAIDVVICEKGADYQITFEGSILNDGTIHGKIADFDLELFCPGDGELLVKDLKDGEWREASELGLGSLTALINPPFALLRNCCSPSQKAKLLGGSPKTTALIGLQIAPENFGEFYPDPVKSLGGGSGIGCVVSVNRETSFIDGVKMSFVDKSSREELFNRSFSFYPQSGCSFKTVYSSDSLIP